MDNRWTLTVENLGRIQEARVEVAPLTLFIGDNNSGKSYLMTILYTLLNLHLSERAGYDLCKDTKEYRDCYDWIVACKERMSRDQRAITPITAEVCGLFERLLNRILSKNLGRIARQAFNEDVDIGKLSVRFPKFDVEELGEESRQGDHHEANYGIIQTFDDDYIVFEEREQPGQSFSHGFLADSPVSRVLEFLLKQQFSLPFGAIFLPTSRTGFLLTYPSLVSASLRQSFDFPNGEERAPMGKLTRPCSDFLKNLAGISPGNLTNRLEQYQEVLDFMEKRMLHGRIVVQNVGPLPSVTYRPDSAERDFPMHLSSGVVTELAPLALMLRHYSVETLFIEEPEMSLHPALQREMARTLIRLVRTGTPVFATTHSDTILTHLNSMVKLARQPEERRKQVLTAIDCEEADLISAEDVAMYQFDVDGADGHTVIRRLYSDTYGFEIPNFNRALEKLVEDARATEPGDEDD